MNLINPKLTNRKFYNKWLYKVTIKIQGCTVLRMVDLDSVKEYCSKKGSYSTAQKAYANREEIFQLVDFLQKYDKESYSSRIERDNIDLYTNNLDFYNDVSKLFEENIKHRFEPDTESLEFLNDSNSSIVVKKYPHNRYRFKVYLLPHKMSKDKDNKSKFVDWLKNQNPRITCTKAIERWFINTDWNWDRRYVLVEDEQTLLMLKLRNSEVVGRIYNYIIPDK